MAAEEPAAEAEAVPAAEAAAAAPPTPAEGEPLADEQKESRERVQVSRVTGLVVEWRGYMGWIQPFTKIDHAQASKHQGRVYLSTKDITQYGDLNLRVKEGRVVDFYVYVDGDGLGAEECRPRSVLRLTLTHKQVNAALKPYKASWSDYLAESKHYPTFEEETGVLLRKYIWEMPFALIELWGHPEEIAKAAVKLSTVSKGDAETCNMRLLVADADTAKSKALSGNPKLSAWPVLNRPLVCKTLNWNASPAECVEAAQLFLKVMGAPPAKAAAGA